MIVVDHVTKYYGSTPAVRDLHFTIEDGECVGFLGLNGAGKSTTLRLLSCLLLPTSGRITIRGMDVESQPHEIRKLIGYLPDTPPLYPEMSVAGFLRFAGKLRRMSRAAIEKRLPEVVATAGLDGVVGQTIGTLSHGYKQRVGIAQAIIHEPALLILDEPIQGLDPVQIVEMREMIGSLRGQHTILVSSHILSEIEQTTDRVLMLHEGRVAAEGTEEELLERFGDAVYVEVEGTEEELAAALDPLLEARAGSFRGSAKEGVTYTSPRDGVVAASIRADDDLRSRVSRAILEADLPLLTLERVPPFERVLVGLAHGTHRSLEEEPS